MFAIITLMNHM